LALYGGIAREMAGRSARSPIEAAVLQVRRIEAGEGVGYNATFIAPRPMRAGVIALGYADGYLRCWSGKGGAFVAGIPIPVLGQISMDLTIVALDAPGCGEGDWLTVDYDPVSAAAISGLSQYELSYPARASLSANLRQVGLCPLLHRTYCIC
jgi:alanine racemase